MRLRRCYVTEPLTSGPRIAAVPSRLTGVCCGVAPKSHKSTQNMLAVEIGCWLPKP